MNKRKFISICSANAALALSGATLCQDAPYKIPQNDNVYYIERRGPRWILGIEDPLTNLTRPRYELLKKRALQVAESLGEEPTFHISAHPLWVMHIYTMWEVTDISEDFIHSVQRSLFPEGECLITLYRNGSHTQRNLCAFTIGVPLGDTVDYPGPDTGAQF